MKKEMVQKRNVFTSAGHTNIVGKDRGAQGNGYIEGDLTVEFRDLVCKNLDTLCISYTKDNNAHALSDTVKAFKGLTKPSDLVIDIHFNAATPKATGCEVFVPSTPTTIELDLAETCARTISETLDIPLRGNFKGRKGIKSEHESQHKQLGWMRLAGHNVLFEICFISNADDMAKYQKHKENLAYKIACIIEKHATTVDAGSVDSIKQTTHAVVSGDYLSKIANQYNVTVDRLKLINGLMSDMIYVGQTLRI